MQGRTQEPEQGGLRGVHKVHCCFQITTGYSKVGQGLAVCDGRLVRAVHIACDRGHGGRLVRRNHSDFLEYTA